ncbi:hypothetical protein A3L11_00805 [Thermococcus siculi]|uniref:DUF2357 domain-containing protein n=1 Tax=Thermococcus siculi TaxID=72803 RepID=A0A2Z2MHK7_9EURY|nr:DUF2357 domain-containing protein [Thermococcus siculi]ASJ07839.1 hypothetical protein A3L11_00805 [Thermococcus siculi]
MPWEPVQRVLDTLEIYSEEKWPNAFYDGQRLILFEWVDYYVKSSLEFEIHGLEIKKIADRYKFRYSNYVGLSEIRLEDGRAIPILVLSRKVGKILGISDSEKCLSSDSIDELIDAFDTLVGSLIGELVKISSTIPFSLKSPTDFSTTESDEPINELFAYHYLRSNGERITSAFETVIRRMKRKLIVEDEWLRPDEIDNITPETLLSIAQHPEYLAPAGEGVLIAEHLNGYAPTRILGFRKYESFDTPENRFAKYFLGLLIEWSERVIDSFWNNRAANVGSIREILGELEFIASDGVWDDVGDMDLFPYTSQTLLKGDGYRDLLELYREFTAYVPFFEEMKRAIDNKDIAKLYEYWAFFRLVEELGGILGEKKLKIHVLPAGELSEKGDVYAEFDNGWRLYYNKRLVPKKWSYSVTLRPDFSLFTGDPKRKDTTLVGVFDAKFKLDVVNEAKGVEEFDEETEIAEKTGNYETWAKLEDVYKMHTYRDALSAKFAVVLYPGGRNVFFEANKGKVERFVLEEVLVGELSGVGYLRIVPEVKE